MYAALGRGVRVQRRAEPFASPPGRNLALNRLSEGVSPYCLASATHLRRPLHCADEEARLKFGAARAALSGVLGEGARFLHR